MESLGTGREVYMKAFALTGRTVSTLLLLL